MTIKREIIPKHDSETYFVGVFLDKKTRVISTFLVDSELGHMDVSQGLSNEQLKDIRVGRFPSDIRYVGRKASFSGEGDVVLASFNITRKKSLGKMLKKLVKEIY
jgi:hypothetical protein